MSRQLSRSLSAQAALAAILVVGVMLLLIVSGHNRDEADKEKAEDSGSSSVADEPQELAGGFVTVPAEEFFTTVIAAQKAADSWRVVSVQEVDGQAAAPSIQDIAGASSEPAIRISLPGAQGRLIGVYVDGTFYVKGIRGSVKPWWQAPASPELEDLLLFADPDRFLGSLSEPESFEVVGVENTDAGPAVHYKVGIEAAALDDEGVENGTQPVQMEMWLDKENRPVQAVTSYTVEGKTATTTLVYSNYGQQLEIAAPPAGQVTTQAPPGARQ
ncbi:hypothetical protein [Nocardioides sp. Soil796]|uniref:hypothetical protein n=1 Tax=Nocardioides sp. Soil796 TaxID=1736412 RepID=UPI00070D2D15|nr:hypothetical protein [Nocardioides sp. Soil796]KRF12966.1 hypothetical protein ASH02_15775 [Nocardioides sp. Soil796]